MASKDKIQAYCQTVTEQVRWKRAHMTIAEELEDHIEDQIDALVHEGMDNGEALEAAVNEMGDPYAVGLLLDRIHRPKTQMSMILLVIGLALIGFFVRALLVDNFESPISLGDDLVFLMLGIGVMFLFYYMDFTLIGKYPLVFSSVIVSVSLLALSIADRINGKAYLYVMFPVSLGYLSLIYPLAIAALIYKARKMAYKGIVLVWCGIMGLNYILTQVPMAIGIVHITTIGFVLMLIAACKEWFGISKVKGVLLSVLLAVTTGSYSVILLIMNDRSKEGISLLMTVWKYEEQEMTIRTLAHQLMSHGRLFGSGSGVDTSMLTSIGLGDIWTDYILAYSIYIYGWLPVLIVFSIVILFLGKGLWYSLRQKSLLGLLVSAAIHMSLAMQVINYTLYNAGIGMLGTLSLPFISYSTTALIINFALTGLMLSVFRSGHAVGDYRFQYRMDNFLQ